jgi:hypothetical protein
MGNLLLLQTPYIVIIQKIESGAGVLSDNYYVVLYNKKLK